jgi:diguanylate cyclase (GGDEF)-like protein
VWNSINAIRDQDGKAIYYVAIQTDLTPLREAQSKIQLLASYDSLTGLPNRALFADRLKQMLAHAQRHNRGFAVMFMDLDHFKEVNDSLGHQVGDELLKSIAQRLLGALRSEDTVARMGGDEFVLLMPAIGREDAIAVADKLLVMVRKPMALGNMLNYRPMASLGIAMYPQDGDTAELLLRNADTAMYEAKLGGRARSAMYTAVMSEVSARTLSIQTELSAGIGRDELRLVYQPKFHLQTGRLVGAEALVRWERPGVGQVAPIEFIPVAQSTGLIVDIDQWVMRESLRQLALWRKQGLWGTDMRMAINQCAADLRRPEMVNELEALLKEYGVSASSLEIEITEGVLMENTREIIERLGELKQLGVTLAIDDFGTGFSSLAYLRNLPITVIKIDKGFVSDMLDNENDRVLVETIITMAHNLGRSLVAEGVETQPQCDRLAALGCEIGQGYLFGKPLLAEAFASMFLEQPYLAAAHLSADAIP